MQENIEIILV